MDGRLACGGRWERETREILLLLLVAGDVYDGVNTSGIGCSHATASTWRAQTYPTYPVIRAGQAKKEYTLSMCVCSQTTVDVQYVRLKAWTLLSLEKRRRSCDFLLVF